MPESYMLGYSRAEQERLQRQAEQLAADSALLFDGLEPMAGWRVVEIGCGPRGCLDQLAARVGEGGQVVGIERSAEAVEMAKGFVAERGLRNVEVVNADARASGLPSDSFDLVTARLVLVNIPRPEEVVAEAVRLVRPGGLLALHEGDAGFVFYEPPCPAWDWFSDIWARYGEANGIDRRIGRKLPGLLRRAGLETIEVRPLVHVHPPGDPRRTLRVEFADNLKDRWIAAGLTDEKSFAAKREEFVRHIADPDTLVVHGPYFQVWGRKPSEGA